MKTSSAYLLVLPFSKRTVDGSSKVLVGCITLGPVVQNRHGYTIFGSCTLYNHTDNDCSLLSYIQIKSISAIYFPQNVSSDIKILSKYIINIRCTQQFLYFESRMKSLKQK